MPILHVRNIPEELHDRIRQHAQTNGRSISAEVIILLERALAAAEYSPEKVLANVRRRRSFRPAERGAPDSTTILRADHQR